MYKLSNSGKIQQWRGHDFSVQHEAGELAGRQPTDSVVDDRKNELEQLENNAYQRGYADAQAANLTLIEEREHLTKLIRSLEKPLLDLNDEVQATILELVLQISERVVKREIGGDLEYYRAMLKQLTRGTIQSSATILVSQEDYNRLNDENLSDSSVKFRVDKNLTQGSCLLETDEQLFDISISSMVRNCLSETEFASSEDENLN